MKCWIVIYNHRHGADAWPVFGDTAPTEEGVIDSLHCWEGPGSSADREDESISIYGPFDVAEHTQ